ncbi:carbohydrate ABC transporter permease [Nocardioides sp. B-3]|uniref:carbohydrate ABC transporter permease n=1 Tax=Nocardioides sp. B-3 TaxID=2895565 RepID=UPI002153A18E|nr:sugar ABC transporter permease [Nocardioides sp. B-3]UUZ60951.1 sugar ABC transporter permease [Nocardioides sp. B-3]
MFVNTIVWTLACVFFHYTIGLGLAVMLNRKFRGRSLYRVLLIVPWAVPAFVSAFAWKFIFNPDRGLFNAALQAIGFEPVARFEHRWTAMFAAICTNIWLGVPFMMVAILGGLQSIPAELYEAAEMDGATPRQRFVNVTLPGLRPVSSTVILLGTIWTFNMFPIIYFVTGGQPAGETEILVTGAYRAAFESIRNYSLAATYGVLILSMLMVYAAVYRRVLKARGEVF